MSHIGGAAVFFFPLPLGISCVTPFHIILCRRLLYSLPHHPHLSRVPSTPAEWRNSLQQSTYRGGTWILSTCYILSLLVILLLASIVQQLCSFRGVQRCRLPTAGRISVSAFCNPALAVCQSESEWVWALGVGKGTKYGDWGASAPPFLFLHAPFFWRFMDLFSQISKYQRGSSVNFATGILSHR